MHQQIIFRSACIDSLFLTLLFHQDLLHGTLETGRSLTSLFLYQGKQTVKTVLYHILRNLVLHFCSRSTASLGINKSKGCIKITFIYHIQCVPEVLFCLPGEAYDNIRSKGNIRDGCTDLLHQLQVFLLVIAPVHDL